MPASGKFSQNNRRWLLLSIILIVCGTVLALRAQWLWLPGLGSFAVLGQLTWAGGWFLFSSLILIRLGTRTWYIWSATVTLVVSLGLSFIIRQQYDSVQALLQSKPLPRTTGQIVQVFQNTVKKTARGAFIEYTYQVHHQYYRQRYYLSSPSQTEAGNALTIVYFPHDPRISAPLLDYEK